MCVKVCSPGAITRIYEEVEGGKRVTYEFDLTSCTFCAMCQDFCDDGAISLTQDYHMVARDARELCTRGTRFAPDLEDLYCSDKCIFCSLCAKGCPQDAITVDRKAKTWAVDLEKCVQCGKCISKCPKKALSFGKPQETEEAPEENAEAKAEAEPEKKAKAKPKKVEEKAEAEPKKAEEKAEAASEKAEAKAEAEPETKAEEKAEAKPE